MRIVLASVSFLSSTVAGYISAAKVSSGYNDIKTLLACVSSLRQHITVYGEGLTYAVASSGIGEKCELFSDIIVLSDLGRNDIFSEALEKSPYPEEIKQSLSFLLTKIRSSDRQTINEAFDNAVQLISEEEKRLRDKKEKDAPLYRKAGILTGLAAAILLL